MGTRALDGSMDEAIFDCIEAGINRCFLMGKHMNRPDGPINKRLHRLEEKREVYSRKTKMDGHHTTVWFIGADPLKPIETTVSPYPIINGREFFTSFLFGAPQASQAQGAV
jgi:hypothetical protein